MDLKQQVTATRHAQTLVAAASQSGQLQETFDELSQLIMICQGTQLDAVLSSDQFQPEEKQRLVRQLGVSHSLLLNGLIEDFIQQEELDLLLPTLQTALSKISQLTKVFDIEVETVQPLTDQQKERIRQLVEERFDIRAHDVVQTLNPNLLGGFIVTVNHQVIDASVRTQLQDLRKKVSS